MGRIATDLTKAGLVDDGDYIGTVQKVTYQIKIGDKWNMEGTQDADEATFNATDDDICRLHYMVSIPGKGSHFNDLYMKDSALGFVQGFMRACDVAYDKNGFDPDEAVGKQVAIEITTIDDPTYGFQNNFRYSKV